jgi:hypothetical protein
MFVIPKKDFLIVDPARRDTLPPEGRDVGEGDSNYWLRRIRDEDVTMVPADKVEAAKAALDKADAARAAAANPPAPKSAVDEKTKIPAPGQK